MNESSHATQNFGLGLHMLIPAQSKVDAKNHYNIKQRWY